MAALAAGASAGITDTASSALQDTYAGLRDAVRRRLAKRGEDGAQVLDARGIDPAAWQVRLTEALVSCGVDRDEEVLEAARSLLRELGTTGSYPRVNIVDARESKGAQFGDNSTQTNTFN
ncbi:hypothetical protein ABT120_40685 [Nonomuraea angiospora]|uniref:hypothetical protein n=1 Tax=Nonomuraea angiospora TaxID=46172 RepID=UPI00332096BE